MIAIIKGLLLGALMWILWDKAGLVGIALVPIGLLGVLYLNQDNLVYIPTRVLRYRTRPDKLPPLQNFDEISLVTLDATKISAWFIKQRDHARKPTIIFLHGNAGHMGDRLDNARGLFTSTLCNIFMVEYRGYGTSEGAPSEDGLKLDAQAALDYLRSRRDVDASNVFVFGRSLGGAVGIWLAWKNPGKLRGLLVENSFTSIRALAMSPDLFPMLRAAPSVVLDMFQSSHWNSLELVGSLQCPVLMLAGQEDEVVPHCQMQQLWERYCRSVAPSSHYGKKPCGGDGGDSQADYAVADAAIARGCCRCCKATDDGREWGALLEEEDGDGDGSPSDWADPRATSRSGGVGGGGTGVVAGGSRSALIARSRFEVFQGGGHNTTWMLPTYYSQIEAWLAQFGRLS